MHAPESGFRLAYDRALAVARVLVEQGISWQRIRIVSCGDAESRALGEASGRGPSVPQRVEIVLTPRLADAPLGHSGP
jgi:outer membrane protein OmpA-like peptidoglycan-associated protein